MKAKIHKLELYIVDSNGSDGDIEEIIQSLEDSTDCFFHLANSKTVEFEWDDELDINRTDATNECYEEYFKL